MRSLRQKAIQTLGGVCVRCGYADARALEIDHIEPLRNSKRQLSQAQMLVDILRGNIDNLQLLCANCHAIKTYEED